MKALFPGSFNPFTIGHDSIVRRALTFSDKVVIAIGYNSDKTDSKSKVENRLQDIKSLYDGNERVEVIAYEGLTVDVANECKADVIVRGIRSVKDFEYERDLADINRKLTGIETVLLYCDPELAAVSSSVVRELIHYGKDVSSFLPARK